MNRPNLPSTLRTQAAVQLQTLELPEHDHLVRAIALSEFASRVCTTQREWLAKEIPRGLFDLAPTPAQIDQAVQSLIVPTTEMAGLQHGLRVVRNRFQFWAVLRHCCGLADLTETTATISSLADKLIEAALVQIYQWQLDEFGTPMGEETGSALRMVVFALGKLGARELNLSSDVDLIFAYPEPGLVDQTNVVANHAIKTNQQFFLRLGQRLIEALNPMTEDGFVFRVDMRLRPYGDSGPLVNHFRAVENYYEAQGRDWERYAFVKARAIGGDIDAGEHLLQNLRPFVFRRYLDFGAIDALRDMKARIVNERRDPNDIKLGSGGIRDAEFAVQVFQLIWGGRQLGLAQPAFLAVVPELVDQGHMSAAAGQQLRAAYVFLRDAEHSIQAYADQQTQMLPTQPAIQEKVALMMGFDSYNKFVTKLAQHRKFVALNFADVVKQPEPAEDLPPSQSQAVPGELGANWDELNEAQCRDLNFTDPGRAMELLGQLVSTRALPRVAVDGRKRLNRLMPLLLAKVSANEQPDLVLERIVPVLLAVMRRSVYLVLLSENPNALEHFVSLSSASPWIAAELARFPAFFDSLLEPKPTLPDRDKLHAELASNIANVDGDMERIYDVLREFKEFHVFKVALAQAQDALPLMKISDYLSFLAETVLQQALQIAWQDAALELPVQQFLIVGYGKLGGIELGPSSDLDLVLIHNDASGTQTNALNRLVRKLLALITTPTILGPLYEVDTRLRPSGSKGTMVSSLPGFEKYQQNTAWLWEHQALVRARAVAGDPKLATAFANLRQRLLCQPRVAQEVANQVAEMRARMIDHQGAGEDVKRGSGGIVDVEFMVQYLVLAHAQEHPSLATYTDNVRILDAVAVAGLLSTAEVDDLQQAYLTLRAQAHQQVFMGANAMPQFEAGPTMSEHRSRVIQLWQKVIEDNRSN